MEKEFLELLKSMNESINQKLDIIDKKLDKIDKRIDGVYDQTFDLSEFKTETTGALKNINNKLDNLQEFREVTEMNAIDIQVLRYRDRKDNKEI
ncbi:hypothetical protein UT300003_33120 [Clostridium sardiniense]